jgi:hypothetical protein
LRDPGIDGDGIFKGIIVKECIAVCSGFIWLRIEACGHGFEYYILSEAGSF